MKLLNLGCGATFHPAWVNIDMVSSSPHVRAYDLRQGLPYPDSYFDACYNSHVLEHLNREQASQMLAECWRVLKPQGVIRVAVPDFEAIARAYLLALEQVCAGVAAGEANYDWMTIELYDQAVRTSVGGEMGRFLRQPDLSNRDFIVSRIGLQADAISSLPRIEESIWKRALGKTPSWYIRKLRYGVSSILVRAIAGVEAQQAFQEGMFRNSGEIHQWIYDRFSLKRLLEQCKFEHILPCQADDSRIPDFNSYNLDVSDNRVRKPDSLFMEGIKS